MLIIYIVIIIIMIMILVYLKRLLNQKKESSAESSMMGGACRRKASRSKRICKIYKHFYGGRLSPEDEEAFLTALRHPETLTYKKILAITNILKEECTPDEIDDFYDQLTDEEFNKVLDRMEELFKEEVEKFRV